MKKSNIIILISLTTLFLILERYLFFCNLNFDSLFNQNLIDKGLDEEGTQLSASFLKYMLPLGVIIKLLLTFIVTALLYLGCKIYDFKVAFKKVFSIVFIAELIIIISGFINFFVLKTKIDTITSLKYLEGYQTLSLQNFYNFNNLTEGLFIALGAISLFQVGYIIALAYGLTLVIKSSFSKAFEIVLFFYISVFLFITIGKLLVTINFN